MTTQPESITTVWSMATYFFLIVAAVSGMLVTSYVLGESRRGRQKGEPYESGIKATGSAGIRFNVTFYRLAVFFVIFDLEAVFIFLWAVVAREVGWIGYAGVVTFIVTLMSVLVYLWKVHALDLAVRRRQDEMP